MPWLKIEEAKKAIVDSVTATTCGFCLNKISKDTALEHFELFQKSENSQDHLIRCHKRDTKAAHEMYPQGRFIWLVAKGSVEVKVAKAKEPEPKPAVALPEEKTMDETAWAAYCGFPSVDAMKATLRKTS